VGTPTGSLFNPRLFAGDLILAGTLSGMQDPSMVLGVHGALVSGKIAAMAVHDRERAAREFRRMTRWWKLGYLTRRLLWATHPWGSRVAVPAVLRLLPHVDQRFLWLLNPAVPGWMQL
jgi:flavin-dependent dehydrogenase